jgi:hypothetical protein
MKVAIKTKNLQPIKVEGSTVRPMGLFSNQMLEFLRVI